MLSQEKRFTLLSRMVAFVLAFLANAAIANATVLVPIDDTYVDRDDAAPHGASTELVAKMKRNTYTNASYNAVSAVMRFKMAPTDIAWDAALLLDVSTYDEAVTCDFKLWGLTDAAGAMQSMEEETANWGTFNGVINDTSIGVNTSSSSIFDANPWTTEHEPLATITLTQADLGKTVRFSSTALTDFINADNDGVVTFIVTRVLRSNSFDTAFASREHQTLSPPRLFVDAYGTVDVSADTYGRYGDATVHGGEAEILVKNNGTNHLNTRRGVVRFELPAGTRVEKANLSLDVTMYYQNVGTVPQTLNFFVYGVRETSSSENFNEATANESTFFNELDGSSDGVINTNVEALGKFPVKITDVGKTVSFTSEALVDFINTDTNGKITLIIARAEYTPYLNFAFAAKEHATKEGPRLSFTQALDDVAAPTMKLVNQDVNGDGTKELLLVVEMPGGNGFVLYDPFSIAEALRIAGYDFGTGTNFWDTLSSIQKSALLATVSAIVPNVGTTVEASELNAARTNLPEGRTYPVATFQGDFESSRGGILVSSSAFTGTSQNALGYTTVQLGSGNAGAMFSDSGVAFGAESNFVTLTTGVGDPSGTTASVNLSMGVGLYGELKYGQDGQYGFSIPLVVAPIGVSVYVKGSDAVHAWNTVVGWAGWISLFDFSRNVGYLVSDFSQDVHLVVVNAIDESAMVVKHHAGTAIVWTKDAGRESTVWLSGAASDVGGKITDAVWAVNDEMMSTTTSAASALTNWSTSAGSTVVSTYDSAVGWVSGGVSTLDDVTGDIASGTGEVVNDVVDEVRCNKLWCF